MPTQPPTYCTACFHQPLREEEDAQLCVECEKEPAIRFCKQCEDAYCLKCFATIHAKGKKSKHKWTNLDGTDPEEYNEAGGTGVTEYAETGMDEWQETWDENTQSYYW